MTHVSKAVITFSLLLTPAIVSAAEFYVSPSGSPSGNGSQSSPWDLKTALDHPAAVRPGDTIWLRGGTYRGTFIGRLTGSPSAPIKVRQYPGERATIDAGNAQAAALQLYGSDTWYWGFEVVFSNASRWGDIWGSMIEVQGINLKLINMILHDGAGGVGLWKGALNAEAYGNLIYNIGYDASDRGHGHGIYTQNQDGTKRIVDNIIFNGFSHGLHAYTEGSTIDNISLEGNIFFNNGVLSRTSGFARNILIGGIPVARNPSAVSNYAYYTPSVGRGENNLGYDGGCSNLAARNNYLVGGTALRLVNCTGNVTGNTFYGRVEGFSQSAYPSNTYLTSRPSSTRVFVRPNRYEPGRAHIAIFNWASQGSVAVDVSGILSPGDSYEVRDAQNYFGTPVASGTYQGGSINIPMGSLLTVAQPLGSPAPARPAHTAPDFAALVLLKRNSGTGTPAPPPVTNSAPVVSAGADKSVTLPASVTLNGSATDDGRPNGTLTYSWSKASGPGTVTFSSASAASTSASFSSAGTYSLRLTVSDGALSASDSVTVTVSPASTPQPATPPPPSTPPPSTPSPTGGLIGHWAFETGDVANNVVQDKSSSNMDGILHGAVSFGAGMAGQALNLNGSRSYVEITNESASADLMTSMTLSAWIRTSNTRRTEGILSKLNAAGIEYGYLFKVEPSGYLGLYLGGNNLPSGNKDVIDNTTKVNDGKWHHVAAVITLGQNVRFYVDGVLASTHTRNVVAGRSSSGLVLGMNPWLPFGDYFTGSLDEVRIYNRALTGTEVGQLAGNTGGSTGGSTGGGTGSGNGSGVTATSGSNIYVEAESASLEDPMVVVSDSSASQGKAIRTPADHYGAATFTVNVPKSGTYIIWGRVKAPDAAHDSFYVSLDGGPEDVYDVAESTWSNSWQWTKVNGRAGGVLPAALNPRTFNLTAGTHRITFRGRDGGTLLDRIFITDSASAVPQN